MKKVGDILIVFGVVLLLISAYFVHVMNDYVDSGFPEAKRESFVFAVTYIRYLTISTPILVTLGVFFQKRSPKTDRKVQLG